LARIFSWRPVTIRHVLSHTSGLAGSSELQQVTGADSTPLKARAHSSVTGPLQWQPGDKYAYGNQGMNIAARTVEIVSGMPYEDFLQKRFYDPLGMKETTFWPDEPQVARLAGAYGPNKEKNGYARGVQCSGGDQWAARDLFLKTATQVFPK
jgi:CubicO group peptidase (beta-lactamase class C family)